MDVGQRTGETTPRGHTVSDGQNILVISDLHLGEDLRAGLDTVHVEWAELAEDLARFVDHYATAPQGDRPWRLIINGDMVDFLSVWLDVGTTDSSEEATHDDRWYGAGSRENFARAKMRAVINHNPRVFAALARFVGKGNALNIVVGNHDAEFHWPGVQAEFREGLVALWTTHPDRTEADRTPEQLSAEVNFHAWFYFEEDLAWIEHGHQYDGYCSVDWVLDPVDPANDREFEQNLGSAVMRYVGNHLPENPEENQDVGFVDYLELARKQSREVLVKVLSGYGTLVMRMYQQWAFRFRHPILYARQRSRHYARLRTLSETSHLPEPTLRALYRLRRRPVFVDLLRVTTSLMFGRLVITVGAMLMVPVLFVLLSWSMLPLGLVVLAVATVLGHIGLALSRDAVDPTEEMKHAAGRIRRLVRAPLVVFGHTHRPMAHRLEHGWYFNTGTWVGGHADMRNFTHMVIQRGSGEVRAAICQWRDGRSWELRAERESV